MDSQSYFSNENTFTNCGVNCVFDMSAGNAIAAGFVYTIYTGTTTFKNCYFNGSFTGITTSNASTQYTSPFYRYISTNSNSKGAVEMDNNYAVNCQTSYDGTDAKYKDYTVNNSNITFKEPSAFTSGEVAYLLNGSQDAGTWRQKLSGEGVNTSPVLKQTDDNKVYYGYADCLATEKSYANSALRQTQGHDFGTDATRSVCTICNHGFFRYTANSRVTPENSSALKDKDGNSIYVEAQHTFSNGQGIMEFNKPLAIIGDNAFYSCAFTGDLVIGNSVQTIGDQAFYNCNFKGNLTLGNSVTSIGKEAFNECPGFTGNLVIPNSVQTIGEKAFCRCDGFTGDLVIGNSVQTIGEEAFYKCSGFKGNLTLGNSVTSIGNSAFNECAGFTGNLVIPNSVQTIGEKAFYKCEGFDGNLTIGNAVKSIGANAFNYCWRLNGDLIIPNSVTNIGEYAFYDCVNFNGNLTIGSSVKSIGKLTFSNNNKLTGVTMRSKPEVGSDAFNKVTNNKTLILDDDSYVYTASNEYFPTLNAAPKYTRTMEDEWGTLVVPFAVSAAPEGFEFYGIRSVGSDNELYLRKVTSSIEAGTPVFVRRTGSGTDLVVTAENTTVSTALATASGVALQGTYTSVALNKTDNPNAYFVYNEKLYSTQKLGDENHVTINPFRAYLVTPVASGAKQLVFVIDGDATSVDQISPLGESEGASVYNLNGQKLSAPRKGINIINGKKVLVK